MARKGMSLPIEMIVVIAIAVLVLVVIVAFFIGGIGPQISRMSDQDAIAQGCTKAGACLIPWETNRIPGYNATCGGESGNTLKIVCCKLGYLDQSECKINACRCSPA